MNGQIEIHMARSVASTGASVPMELGDPHPQPFGTQMDSCHQSESSESTLFWGVFTEALSPRQY